MCKRLLYILPIFMFHAAFSQKVTDTFKLYFDLNVPALSAKMEKKIDLLIYNDKIIPGSSITIIGYADYLGSEGYNKELSMKRARNVKDYMIKYGIDEKDITLCVGRGKIDREGVSGSDGMPIDRRVDIAINNRKKPGIASNKRKSGKRDTVWPVEVTDVDGINSLKVGSIFKLRNVYFPADRHIMKEESLETLEKLYVVLKNHPQIKISIEGHVCCIRDAPDALDIDTYEPALSLNRAKAIYNYLVTKGINPDRLTYMGFGRRRPIVEYEQNEEDAEKNRRVEIRITENQ